MSRNRTIVLGKTHDGMVVCLKSPRRLPRKQKKAIKARAMADVLTTMIEQWLEMNGLPKEGIYDN